MEGKEAFAKLLILPNVYRVLKPGGVNMIYEIYPFLRPFDDSMKVIKPDDIIRGLKVSREEVDRMYDWKENPRMGLRDWLCVIGKKD